ncbi:MAG TPA: hypothetical protein DHU59_09725 [Clostridiales bacterium]|nr:hypothetical protein [Clostridiales bacterium]
MVLRVDNLSKSFNNEIVFDNISFSVSKGEIACIRGKSGEGKTTLLRCINNLELPDKGSIKINDMYLCREEGNTVKFNSAPDITKNKRNNGFVILSTFLNVSSLYFDMLVNTAPIAMHTNNEDSPAIFDIPIHKKIIANAMVNLLPFPVYHAIINFNIIPIIAPNNIDPTISIIGSIKVVNIETSPALPIDLANATDKPKHIKAIASSIATTGNKVFVTGPFALYCLTTINVAAGAVAAAIAPNTNEKDTSFPVNIKTKSTTNTAHTASAKAITMGAFPTIFKYDSLNSAPMEKAIIPNAISGMMANFSIASNVNMFRQYGPAIRPIIMYPVTCGNLTFSITLIDRIPKIKANDK